MSSPVQNRKTSVATVPPCRMSEMSHPWTRPPEFAKYTTPSRKATEFSIETSHCVSIGPLEGGPSGCRGQRGAGRPSLGSSRRSWDRRARAHRIPSHDAGGSRTGSCSPRPRSGSPPAGAERRPNRRSTSGEAPRWSQSTDQSSVGHRPIRRDHAQLVVARARVVERDSRRSRSWPSPSPGRRSGRPAAAGSRTRRRGSGSHRRTRPRAPASRPATGTTFGCPVHPVPHHCFCGPVCVSADIAHIFEPSEG